MQPEIVRGIFMNGAQNVERFHQSHGAERKADTFLQYASPQLADFQASPAEIKDKSRRIQIPHRPQRRHTDEARLFFAGDDFEFDFRLVPQAFDKNVAIAGLASGARGDGAVRHYAVPVHYSAKLSKGIGCIAQGFAIEFSGRECGMAQAHRRTDGFDNFPIIRGVDTGDNKPESVGARIDRGEVPWFG